MYLKPSKVDSLSLISLPQIAYRWAVSIHYVCARMCVCHSLEKPSLIPPDVIFHLGMMQVQSTSPLRDNESPLPGLKLGMS